MGVDGDLKRHPNRKNANPKRHQQVKHDKNPRLIGSLVSLLCDELVEGIRVHFGHVQVDSD